METRLEKANRLATELKHAKKQGDRHLKFA